MATLRGDLARPHVQILAHQQDHLYPARCGEKTIAPEAVNAIASTAAEIVRDVATGAFTEVAVSDLEDGLFRDARDRANEAIADFRTFIDRPQSPYGAFAEDLDLIET